VNRLSAPWQHQPFVGSSRSLPTIAVQAASQLPAAERPLRCLHLTRSWSSHFSFFIVRERIASSFSFLSTFQRQGISQIQMPSLCAETSISNLRSSRQAELFVWVELFSTATISNNTRYEEIEPRRHQNRRPVGTSCTHIVWAVLGVGLNEEADGDAHPTLV